MLFFEQLMMNDENEVMSQRAAMAVQDPFLNVLRKTGMPVAIFLVNGIKLQGQIDSFDQYVVLLKNSVNQMIYKHAISSIVPNRLVRIGPDGEPEVTDPEPEEGIGNQAHGRSGRYRRPSY